MVAAMCFVGPVLRNPNTEALTCSFSDSTGPAVLSCSMHGETESTVWTTFPYGSNYWLDCPDDTGVILPAFAILATSLSMRSKAREWLTDYWKGLTDPTHAADMNQAGKCSLLRITMAAELFLVF